MTIWVAEIQGRAIVAFSAETHDVAESIVDSEPFKSDLMVLENDGQPLWDGQSEIYVREAVTEERAAWDSSKARAVVDSKVRAVGDQDIQEFKSEDDWVVYLLPVTDPTDDE